MALFSMFFHTARSSRFPLGVNIATLLNLAVWKNIEKSAIRRFFGKG
jgi:hypothetical protein